LRISQANKAKVTTLESTEFSSERGEFEFALCELGLESGQLSAFLVQFLFFGGFDTDDLPTDDAFLL
jgi:hypothetical protein